MSDKRDQSKYGDKAKNKNIANGKNGSMNSLLSDVCTDFLTVVYQEDIGSSLMAFTHPKDDKEFRHLQYEDYPILRTIQDNVIGHDLVINTPYGHRKLVYCDFTASGRQMGFIEDYIRQNVFPSYANTHSSTGHNAIQTSKYREEARSIIKKCVNAGKDDVVIFTGSGSTSALHKFAWSMKVNQKHVAKETVVIIGPYEHHSNIVPWREYGTEVVRLRDIPATGLVDMQHLENELVRWKEKKTQLLVCISAASNVTGILTDTDRVATIAHKHGATVLFDFAAGGPYIKIDMNPSKKGYKDAVIISPHKFVGGPGTPGVLIAKKWIFKNPVPDRVGGGTVNYVTREIHSYLGHLEEREEGGTPAITESIRAGLAFKLKQDVGEHVIAERDEDLCSRAFSVWEQNPAIYILGNHSTSRLPIFSFLTKHTESGKLVHHNFISTLLSDLFGIQARGGCACAGPYAADLLGMPEPLAKRYAWFLSEQYEKSDSSVPKISLQIMKPGFTRLNLVYFNEDEVIDYVISAVDMVTKHGWKLLPQYTFEIETGSWQHRDFSNRKEGQLKSLDDATIFIQQKASKLTVHKEPSNTHSFNEVLAAAKEIFDEAGSVARWMRNSPKTEELLKSVPKDLHHLVWFLTPSEAVSFLLDRNKALTQEKYILPFQLVTPVKRIIPQYDSDYHSAESMQSSGSVGSVTSETKDTGENIHQYSHKPVPKDHVPYKPVPRIQAQLNEDDKTGHASRLIIGRKPDSRQVYHQLKSDMLQAMPQYYSITNRPAALLPQGHPLVGNRNQRVHVNVPMARSEKEASIKIQQEARNHNQPSGRLVQSQMKNPGNTYYIKLNSDRPIKC